MESPAPQAKPKADTGQCNLDRAPINLNALRDLCKEELVDILSSLDGGTKQKKALILDPKLTGPLGLLVEFDFLKSLNCEKIYVLTPSRMDIPPDIRHIIYMTRPHATLVKWAIDQILGFRETNRSVTILNVPRRTVISEKLVESANLSNVVKTLNFHMEMVPLDVDVLSLELSSVLKENFVDGDSSSLFYVAKALMKIQGMYGVIPHIKGKGVTSQSIATMMLKMRREMQLGLSQTESPAISEVILIDRLTDPITPLLTMLTYEGLVDEFFGIQNSSVELPAEMVIDPSQTKDKAPLSQAERLKKLKVPLNSNDPIYSDIRDLNFAKVGPSLNEKAKAIDEYYKKRHETQTLSALKIYVGQFADMQARHKALRIHTNIVKVLLNWTTDGIFQQQLEAEQNVIAENPIEMTLEYIEECINKQEPLVKVLRLVCLLSLCSGGLKEKIHTFLTKEIVQTYGYEVMYTLNNLQKLGFFRKAGESKIGNWFTQIKQPMRLMVVEVNEKEPDDIAFTYSGYAPLSVRFVEYARHSNLAAQAAAAASSSPTTTTTTNPQSLSPGGSGTTSTSVMTSSSMVSPTSSNFVGTSSSLSKNRLAEDPIREGWGLPRSMEDAVRSTPGPTFHIQQSFTSGPSNPFDEMEAGSKTDITLVVFIGGVTYTEISALRWLSQRASKSQKKFMILTTSIINGNSLMESVFEDITPRADVY